MTIEQFKADMREAATAPEAETQPAPELAESQAPESEPPGTDTPDPEVSESVPGPEVEEPPPPKTTKEWLKTDGPKDIKALYEQTIPGTDITWGEAKDAAPELENISRLTLDIQQKSDQMQQTQDTERAQMGTVLQRLVAEFGEAKIQQLVDIAPDDVAQSREAQRADLLRWRPELSDPTQYDTALNDIAGAASVYGIPRTSIETMTTPYKRAFMRLGQLEGYLDTLRKPAETKKQVRQASKKQPVKPRGKTKSPVTRSAKQQVFVDQMREASRN